MRNYIASFATIMSERSRGGVVPLTRTNRKPSKEAKFVQADMRQSAEPHRKIADAITFPLGNLTRSTAAVGCMTSCAMYRMEPSQEYCLPTR